MSSFALPVRAERSGDLGWRTCRSCFNILARDNTQAGLNSAAGGFKGTFSKISKTVALGMGGAAVALLGFTKDAAESARVGRMTEAVVKSTGGAAGVTADQVGDLATAISNKTGADDEAIQSGANLLLTFTSVRNELGKGNDIFNQATQTATDMAAAMNGGQVTAEGLKTANIQLGKALNDPIKGVGALSKVGVSFTAQQKEQIKTLVASGKTMEAQKIILAELGKEFGGQAAAAADPMVKLQTVLGNVAETLGTILLPYVEKASVLFAKLGTWVADNQGKTKALITVAAILGTTILVVNAGMRAYAFGQRALIALTRAWMFAQMRLNVALLANPVGLVVVACVALAAVFVLLWKRSDTFRRIVTAAFRGMKIVVVTVMQGLADVILGFWGMVIDGAAKAFGWVPGIGSKLKGAAAKFHDFRDSVNASLNGIKNPKSLHIAVTDDTAAAVRRVRNLRAEVQGGGWSIAIKSSGPPAGVGVRLPARASGGPVVAGGTYLVGEEGPEIVTMGGSGFVTPNHALRGGGARAAGGGGTVVLDVRGADREMLALIRRMVRVEGGGSVQAAFGRPS